MKKLKRYRIHKSICDTCNGNGFVKIIDREDPKETNVHQCWDCESEGEIHVYEPKMVSDDAVDNSDHNADELH